MHPDISLAQVLIQVLSEVVDLATEQSGMEWYVDAREWLPDSSFSDGHHMLRPGAELFSDRLNREVIAPWVGK